MQSRSQKPREQIAGRSRDDSTKMAKFWKKVAERSSDRGWRSSDRRPTVKQYFFDVLSNSEKFWKKSLNGHATVVGSHATVDRLSTFFRRFKRFGIFFKKVAERSRDSGRRSRDHRPTVKQRLFDVPSNSEKFWKMSLNGHATVVKGHTTVGRLSSSVFLTFQAIRKIFEKSRWTVTRQWSEVTRPSTDCKTTFGNFFKKVAERSRDSGWRSRARQPTVKQRFFDVSGNSENFWKESLNGHATVVGSHATVDRLSNNVFFDVSSDSEMFSKKSLNGHATVVGGHATVDRLSNNVFFDVPSNSEKFWKMSLNGHATVVKGHTTVGRLSNSVFSTFQAIRKNFEKSRWTVTRQWSEVTRPSTDCKTTFGNVFKKVAERSRDSGWRSRARQPTVKQRFFDVSGNSEIFWKESLNGHATVVGSHATVDRLSNNVFSTFQAIRKCFQKSRWTVTRQWLEITRPSADCQTTFFRRFRQFGNFLKRVAERSRDSGRKSRDRRSTVKQRFFDVSSDSEIFSKKSLNGHATVVGGHATVDRLSNNVFSTFQAIRKNFEKSRWTVTRQWSEVTRPSTDCKTIFFRRFKQFGKILKKFAERSRDSGRKSRDRRPTVKQLSEMFSKKSLNGHATVVGDHAPVSRLSNNVFSTFQAIRKYSEKSRWTVTRQWSEVTRPSIDCQTTFFRRFKRFGIFSKKSLNGHATVVGSHATVDRL